LPILDFHREHSPRALIVHQMRVESLDRDRLGRRRSPLARDVDRTERARAYACDKLIPTPTSSASGARCSVPWRWGMQHGPRHDRCEGRGDLRSGSASAAGRQRSSIGCRLQ
jgi:hypothetical protein